MVKSQFSKIIASKSFDGFRYPTLVKAVKTLNEIIDNSNDKEEAAKLKTTRLRILNTLEAR